MLVLIPMAYLGMTIFDLGAAVTGGALTNIGDAVTIIFGTVVQGAGGTILSILIGGLLGLLMLGFFPLHWLLYYRPDNIGFAFGVFIPWMLTGIIAAGISAKSARGGFNTGMAVGIGYGIIGTVLSLALIILLEANLPGAALVINAVSLGFTDLPLVIAIILANLEGGLVAGIFGGFIGALKYNPAEAKAEAGKIKYKVKPTGAFVNKNLAPIGGAATPAYPVAPAYQTQAPAPSYVAQGKKCPQCGTVSTGTDKFCMNCGFQME